MRFRPAIILRLALRDLVHGWRSSVCLTAAVMVALIPLLVLYGMKFGVVQNLLEQLRSDPRILEMSLTADTEIEPDLMAQLAEDPRTGFLLPRTRYLSARVDLRAPEGKKFIEVGILPTAQGDPVLDGLPVPKGLFQVALSEGVATRSGAVAGGDVDLVIRRTVGETRQAKRLSVRAITVVPRGRLQSNVILADRALETAIERWREGLAVPELDWEGATEAAGTEAKNRTVASFRLYASDIRAVPSLRDDLLAEGLDIKTNAERVEQTLVIEEGLGLVFVIVSTLGAVGFVITLGLHLVAAVEEKSRELSLLRLLGLTSAELALLPSLQGAAIGLTGALAAVILALLTQPMLNRALDGLAGLEGNISQLTPAHFLAALFATTLAGALAGSIAGFRAAQLEPTKGLRRD